MLAARADTVPLPLAELKGASIRASTARSYSIAWPVVVCWRLRSSAGERSSRWRLAVRQRNVVARRSPLRCWLAAVGRWGRLGAGGAAATAWAIA